MYSCLCNLSDSAYFNLLNAQDDEAPKSNSYVPQSLSNEDIAGKGLRMYNTRLSKFYEPNAGYSFWEPPLSDPEPLKRPKGHKISFADDPPYAAPKWPYDKNYLWKEPGKCVCYNSDEKTKFTLVRDKLPVWVTINASKT